MFSEQGVQPNRRSRYQSSVDYSQEPPCYLFSTLLRQIKLATLNLDVDMFAMIFLAEL